MTNPDDASSLISTTSLHTESTETDETLVVKLGGSVITEKGRPETVDNESLDEVTAALASGTSMADSSSSTPSLIVVHGGGSFGHHHAEVHDIDTERGTHDPVAVTDIHAAMLELDAAVIDSLHSVGLPAVPIQPLSCASRDADGRLSIASTPVERLLAEGFVPVLHGDVVAHAGRGCTVLSGDELVVTLADTVAVDRVGVCSTVPGVLGADGDVVETIDSFDAVRDILGTSNSTDVTGGMAGKVRTLLDCNVPASVFGPSDIGAFIEDDHPGTTIDPS